MYSFVKEQGFTLVEIAIGLAMNSILVIAFATILFMNERQSNAIRERIHMQNDMIVLDAYIHGYLLATNADSLHIYSNEADEQNQITSTTGTIMSTKDIEGNVFRVNTSNNIMNWSRNDTVVEPLSTTVSNLIFTESQPGVNTYMRLDIDLAGKYDTTNFVRYVCPRN